MTETYEPAILAWHFLAKAGILRDGRPLIIGEWIEHTGELKLCESGFHASVKALHALSYAPGPHICRVYCGGKMIFGDDKLVCSRRKPIWTLDATDILRRFARRCASDVLHLWDAPQVAKDYLESGRKDIRTAAWATAWAARDAAGDAARAASLAAARDAAWEKYNGWLEEMLTAGKPQEVPA